MIHKHFQNKDQGKTKFKELVLAVITNPSRKCQSFPQLLHWSNKKNVNKVFYILFKTFILPKSHKSHVISRRLPKQQFRWLLGRTRVRCSWKSVSTLHHFHSTRSDETANNLVCLSGSRLDQKSTKNKLGRNVSERDFDLLPAFHSEGVWHDLNSRDGKLRFTWSMNRRHVLTRSVADSVWPAFAWICE